MAEPDDEESHGGAGARTLGNAFWNGIEKLAVSLGLGSPHTIFKIRKARARWEHRREERANLERGVAYTHKACPACGRLVARGTKRCPYCAANVRWAQGPGIARTLGLSMPHGSVAMTLIAANLLLFAVSTLASARAADDDVAQPLLDSLFHPDLRVLYNMGGLSALSLVSGEPWRLFTYQFLHGGALHIFFNLFALFSLGPTTEDVYGPSKTAFLYWLTGTAAGMTTVSLRILMSGRAPLLPITIGASGAIFGLIGLLIGHASRRGGAQAAYLKSFLVRWAVYGLVMGFMIGADNAAHVGGLVSGLILGFIVPDGAPRQGLSATLWWLGAAAAAVLTLFGFVAAAFFSPHA